MKSFKEMYEAVEPNEKELFNKALAQAAADSPASFSGNSNKFSGEVVLGTDAVSKVKIDLTFNPTVDGVDITFNFEQGAEGSEELKVNESPELGIALEKLLKKSGITFMTADCSEKGITIRSETGKTQSKPFMNKANKLFALFTEETIGKLVEDTIGDYASTESHVSNALKFAGVEKTEEQNGRQTFKIDDKTFKALGQYAKSKFKDFDTSQSGKREIIRASIDKRHFWIERDIETKDGYISVH